MTFADRLKQARQHKNLSQTELAQKVGIHYTQIGRYEKKGAQPAADILAKIAGTLGVSSDYLMNGTAEQIAKDTLTDKDLLNQFKAIEQMEETDKYVIKTLLDAFITKKHLQKLIH